MRIERIDLGTEEPNQLLERARELLSEEDYRKLRAAVDTLEYLTELVADKDTTIRHLRQLLLPAGTEKTQVGDLFMSLIHSCELCGANSFDYLTELQRHVRELAAIVG